MRDLCGVTQPNLKEAHLPVSRVVKTGKIFKGHEKITVLSKMGQLLPLEGKALMRQSPTQAVNFSGGRMLWTLLELAEGSDLSGV